MTGSLESRIRALEEAVPCGYGTFDCEGKPVIQSDLPALEWYVWATELLNSRSREAEKAELVRQLTRSVGRDNGGGRIYEVVAALIPGFEENGGNNANQ